jgi:hypothetical protein
MKTKYTLLALVGFMFAGLVLSSCGDPRKNCNHPDHGRYMNEKLMKKRGM